MPNVIEFYVDKVFSANFPFSVGLDVVCPAGVQDVLGLEELVMFSSELSGSPL